MMKVRLLFSLIGLMMLACCNYKMKVPNTDIGVAEAFINDILKNNFKDAEILVLNDTANNQYFTLFKKEFKSKSKEELQNYSDASIVVNEISPINDSVTVVNYSNSFKRDKSNKLKMVRINGQWQVDLKYTFSGNL